MAPQKKGQKQRNSTRKKRRTYTDAELAIRPLNTVAHPSAITKHGKKGKVLVPDGDAGRDLVQGILDQVNLDVEGQVRSKLQRVRDLEAVRERKRSEMEAKERSRAALLEKKKAEIRKDKSGPATGTFGIGDADATSTRAKRDRKTSVDGDGGAGHGGRTERKPFMGDYRNKKAKRDVNDTKGKKTVSFEA